MAFSKMQRFLCMIYVFAHLLAAARRAISARRFLLNLAALERRGAERIGHLDQTFAPAGTPMAGSTSIPGKAGVVCFLSGKRLVHVEMRQCQRREDLDRLPRRHRVVCSRTRSRCAVTGVVSGERCSMRS
jgi:hypothetical protein